MASLALAADALLVSKKVLSWPGPRSLRRRSPALNSWHWKPIQLRYRRSLCVM
jgi:hypothetical protein